MKVFDSKVINHEFFERAYAIKEKIKEMHFKAEDLIRVQHEKERLIEIRKIEISESEKLKRQNILELDKEIAEKDRIVKNYLNLNII